MEEIGNFLGFENVRPPSAKDVPLPQNLINIEPTKRFVRREFGTPWIGRTPCKNKHVSKAMEALKEIVEDSDQLATAGTSKLFILCMFTKSRYTYCCLFYDCWFAMNSW